MVDTFVIDNDVYYNISDRLQDLSEGQEGYAQIMDSATHWLCEKTELNFTKHLVYPISDKGYLIDDSGELTTDWKVVEGVLLKKQEEHPMV